MTTAVVTPETWSLLQSDCVARDSLTASRALFLPLMRFIQFPPPPRETTRVYSQHASALSATGDQASRSRSAPVVSHHFDGLLHVRPSRILHLVSAMGFVTFHASLPSPPSRKRLTDGWASQAIPVPGFIPPKESRLSVAAPHHCGRCPPAVRSAPRQAPKNLASRTRASSNARTVCKHAILVFPVRPRTDTQARRARTPKRARGPPKRPLSSQGVKTRRKQNRCRSIAAEHRPKPISVHHRCLQPEPKSEHPEPKPEHTIGRSQPCGRTCNLPRAGRRPKHHDRSRSTSARRHRDASAAKREDSDWVKLKPVASYVPPRHQVRTAPKRCRASAASPRAGLLPREGHPAHRPKQVYEKQIDHPHPKTCVPRQSSKLLIEEPSPTEVVEWLPSQRPRPPPPKRRRPTAEAARQTECHNASPKRRDDGTATNR